MIDDAAVAAGARAGGVGVGAVVLEVEAEAVREGLLDDLVVVEAVAGGMIEGVGDFNQIVALVGVLGVQGNRGAGVGVGEVDLRDVAIGRHN
jgi:hypothetical protein